MNSTPPHLPLLYLECFAVFIALPLTIHSVDGIKLIFLTLWAFSIVCLIFLVKQPDFDKKQLVSTKEVTLHNLKPILLRFTLLAPVVTIFTYIYHEERLFSLVSTQPLTWFLVMLLYPILSVYPQELLYRMYFFTRYRPIFRKPWQMIAISSFLFGYAHIVFNNWISISFTLVGGVMFSHTYHKHQSLLLTTIEHALYGCFIFTIGLGWFFYHAADR